MIFCPYEINILSMPIVRAARSLYPHQKKALGHRKLFLEMRLGKTLICIRYLLSFPSLGRILIVAPCTVMPVWAEELQKEGVTDFSLLDGSRKRREALLAENKQWVISNYEMVPSLDIQEINWHVVVLDESIRIANPRSKTTKFFLKNFRDVPIKMVLCGKANPQDNLQFVCQMIFSDGHFMGYKNYWSFLRRNYLNMGYEWVPMPGVWKSMREYVSQNSCLLTRQAVGIGSKKIYEKRIVDMTSEQVKQHKSILRDLEYGDCVLKNHLQRNIALARISGGFSCIDHTICISPRKANEIVSLLRGELQNEKVLIWCRFIIEAEFLSNYLTSRKIENVLVHGNVNDRPFQKRRFMQNKEIQASVMTIASSAKGGNWSAASTAIYYSNEYSNDLRSQSEDRPIHPEKKEPILLIDLLTKGSIDMDVIEVLKERKFSEKWFSDYITEKYCAEQTA